MGSGVVGKACSLYLFLSSFLWAPEQSGKNNIGGKHFFHFQYFAPKNGSKGLSVKTCRPLRNIDHSANFWLVLFFQRILSKWPPNLEKKVRGKMVGRDQHPNEVYHATVLMSRNHPLRWVYLPKGSAQIFLAAQLLCDGPKGHIGRTSGIIYTFRRCKQVLF